MSSIRYLFDFTSPYSYLGIARYEAVVQKHSISIEWHPFYLGAVFKAQRTAPPHTIDTRRQYLMEDIKRMANMLGVNYTMPKVFPFKSVNALRVSLAVEAQRRRELIDLLFSGAFFEGLNLGDDDVLQGYLSDNKFDGQSLLEQAKTAAIKDALRHNTDWAMQHGVFGAPTVFYKDKMLWGCDRADVLDYLISEQ